MWESYRLLVILLVKKMAVEEERVVEVSQRAENLFYAFNKV